MHGAGNQLLAGPCLTKNQDDGITGGNLSYLIEDVPEPIALADNILIVVLQFDFILQIGSFRLQLVF